MNGLTCARFMVFLFGVLAWTQSERLGAEPMGTAFTYQGKLSNAGATATGLYDLRFDLGSQLGEHRRE